MPQTGFGDLKIFSGSAHPRLAREIAQFLGVPLGQARLRRFPDTEVSFQIDENIRGTDIFLVQPTCAPVDQHLVEMLIMIDAFRRSLQFPTKSELYHGEVYIEVSRTPASSGAPLAVTQHADGETIDVAGSDATEGVAKSMNLPTDPAPATDDVPGTSASKTVLSRSASGVTLVVFQFQPDPIHAGNVESDGRI